MGEPPCEQLFVFMNTSVLFCDGITYKDKFVGEPSILCFYPSIALFFILFFAPTHLTRRLQP